MDEKQMKDAKDTQASAKAAHTVGKAAATHFGGKVGGKAYDALSQTKLGQNLERSLGNNIKKNKLLNKAANKLNDSGALDAANNLMESGKGKDTKKPSTPAKSAGAAPTKPSANTPAPSPKGIEANNEGTGKAATNVLKVIAAALPVGIIILPIVIFVVLVSVFISVFQLLDVNKSNLALGGYYSVRCPEVTVIFVDKQNGYTETGSKTYSLEEYVAGVIAGEVAYLGNYEVDKVYAIAARSYFLTHDDGNCTIEASDRKQAFRELTENQNDQMALQAAEETAGQVLLKNNEVYGSQYDAFACIAEDSNYYTISQGNQKIPKEWVESRINKERHPNWFICNGKENLKNHHGNGMSQFGALYLASEKGYTYDEIISFYLGDEVKISSNGLMTSVAGLEIKNTTNSQLLTAPISNILSTNGATIKDMDDFIYRNVTEAGKGTREAVVTAAVSQINYLYDNYKVRAPYYWGGNYQRYGMPSNLGAKTVTSCSSTSCYYNVGFDCSGFVSWAIKNGGYTLNRLTTVEFDSKFSSNSCNIKDSNCIGQPGDLINSRKCHVQMIVAVDESSGKYMVAESTGSLGVVMREWNMHSSNCGNAETRILHMDSYYNNSNNVDPNY